MSYKTFISAIFCFYLANGLPQIDSEYPQNGRYSFKYIPRDVWVADPSTVVKPLKGPVPYVVIHHTYKPDACNTSDSCARAMRSMQDFHNSKGWGDIGYKAKNRTDRPQYSRFLLRVNSFCVGTMGDVYEGRGWETVGVHAGRANNRSIGICLIGDWRVVPPPTTMLESTQKLITSGVDQGHIESNYKLVAHNQIMSTECPGEALFNIISTWDHFAKEVPELYTKRS